MTREVRTQKELAALVGISTSSLRRARFVRNNGTPELYRVVANGMMALYSAVKLAKLPPEEQLAALREKGLA